MDEDKTQIEQVDQTEQTTPEDDFDQGFDLNEHEETNQSVEQPEPQPESAPQDTPEQSQPAPQTEQPAPAPQPQPVQQPQYQQPAPQYQQQQYQQQQQAQYFQNQQAPRQPQQPKLVEIDDNIKAELEELKKLNPNAAYLAQTDTPIGKRLRTRLETYGADLALESAENYMMKADFSRRIEEERSTRLRSEQQRAEAEFHNTFMQRQPQYRTLWVEAQKDPAKANEFYNLTMDVKKWIESKPYGEGQALMQIATSSRDANQVCDMLDQYYKERGKTVSPVNTARNDPTGAFAVPSRGTVPQTGVGDKNSFDDGWAINENEERRR